MEATLKGRYPQNCAINRNAAPTRPLSASSEKPATQQREKLRKNSLGN